MTMRIENIERDNSITYSYNIAEMYNTIVKLEKEINELKARLDELDGGTE